MGCSANLHVASLQLYDWDHRYRRISFAVHHLRSTKLERSNKLGIEAQMEQNTQYFMFGRGDRPGGLRPSPLRHARNKFLCVSSLHDPCDYDISLRKISVAEPNLLRRQNKRANLTADSHILAGETGLEPATPGFGDQCSTN